MGNVLVSIIVPIYQVEEYLQECIESIRNQTYSNLEIILVDDGSKDACPQICDEYQKKDKRIKVVHQVNKGLAAARNKGIDIATGAYYVFVDSDDYIHPQMIEILLDIACRTNADISFCNYTKKEDTFENIIYEQDVKILKYNREEILQKLMVSDNIPFVIACCKLYRKELFENLRFCEGRLHEDEFIIHWLYDRCKIVCCVECELYYYRQREGSITSFISEQSAQDKIDCAKDRVAFFECKDEQLFPEAVALYLYLLIWLYYKVDKKELKQYIYETYKKEYLMYISKVRFCFLRKFRLRVFYVNPFLYRFMLLK